jgi:hypothetical protein
MTKKISRRDEVIAMLKRKSGATVEQIVAKTGMLPHSARALISGIAKDETVNKSKNGSKPTVYSIAETEAKAA